MEGKYVENLLGKEALLLAVLSAFSYVIAMAYEIGRLSFYGIPIRFISLDTSIIVIIFTVLLFPLFYIGFLVAQGQIELRSKKSNSEQLNQKLATLASILCFMVGVAIDKDTEIIKLVLVGGIIFTMVFLVFYGVIAIFSLKRTSFDKSKYLNSIELVNSFISLREKTIGFKVAASALVLISLIFFAGSMGFMGQANQKYFLVIDERPDAFLVANYGSRMIFKSWDTNQEYFSNCFEIVDVSNTPIKFRQKKIEKKLKRSDIYQNSDSCY